MYRYLCHRVTKQLKLLELKITTPILQLINLNILMKYFFFRIIQDEPLPESLHEPDTF